VSRVSRYIAAPTGQAWKIAKGGHLLAQELADDTASGFYSIAGRDLEREIVPMLESEKVGLLVFSPLAGAAFR